MKLTFMLLSALAAFQAFGNEDGTHWVHGTCWQTNSRNEWVRTLPDEDCPGEPSYRWVKPSGHGVAYCLKFNAGGRMVERVSESLCPGPISYRWVVSPTTGTQYCFAFNPRGERLTSRDSAYCERR